MIPNLLKQPISAIPRKFLVMGALGKIGRALIPLLQSKYGKNAVVATDIAKLYNESAPYTVIPMSILELAKLDVLIRDNKVTNIINLVNTLPSVGEIDHKKMMELNIRGIENILDIANLHKCSVFNCSSIAVFEGLTTEKKKSEESLMLPSTLYGVTKMYAELLGQYYHSRFALDFRSLRYPILLSSEPYNSKELALYMNQMFFAAKEEKEYECYVNPSTKLPVMHIDDCAKAIHMLVEADGNKLTRRVYNLAGLEFTTEELVDEIRKHKPNFVCVFKPDYRQARIDEWPQVIEAPSNKDWGWAFTPSLEELVRKIFDDINSNSKLT